MQNNNVESSIEINASEFSKSKQQQSSDNSKMVDNDTSVGKSCPLSINETAVGIKKPIDSDSKSSGLRSKVVRHLNFFTRIRSPPNHKNNSSSTTTATLHVPIGREDVGPSFNKSGSKNHSISSTSTPTVVASHDSLDLQQQQQKQVKPPKIIIKSILKPSLSDTNNNNNVDDEDSAEANNSSSSQNDSMHRFYITRLKHSLIISFLLLIPIQNLFLFSLVIYVLITLNHLVPLIRTKSRHLATIEYTTFILFNIIAIYSILPLRRRYTIILSGIISVTNILLLCYMLLNSKLHNIVIIKKLVCYCVIYFIANVYGIYHQTLNSISQEDTYKNTIKFLNGRIKLEKEKQQQEMLMVSVLPAHIALEMKSEMLQKIRKAQLKSFINSNSSAEDSYSRQRKNVKYY